MKSSPFSIAATVVLAFATHAQAQTGPNVTFNTDARPAAHAVQTGRSIAAAQREQNSRNGDQAEDAASAFAFGAL